MVLLKILHSSIYKSTVTDHEGVGPANIDDSEI